MRRTDGTFIARVDMLYRRAEVIIEYDGDYHRTDKQRWKTDNRQRQELMDMGYRHIVITADGLGAGSSATLRRIRMALE